MGRMIWGGGGVSVGRVIVGGDCGELIVGRVIVSEGGECGKVIVGRVIVGRVIVSEG